MALLALDDVHVHFATAGGLVRAVNGISLELAVGETLGLVGESGCGKSTLVRLLTRTLPVTDGQIRFLGADLALIDPNLMPQHKARREVQMVFQDAHDSLNPRYSAFDTIAEPLRLLAGVKDASGGALSGATVSFHTYVDPNPRSVTYDAGGNVTSYKAGTLDSSDNIVKVVNYSGIGVDGVAFTADDVVSGYTTYTYDASGNLQQTASSMGELTGGPIPDVARAVAIRNRAHDLRKAERLPWSEAFARAEKEMNK